MSNAKKRELIFIKKFIKDTTEFDAGFQAIARKLSNGDNLLAEELRSEMHIAVLSMEIGRDKAYYFRAAKNKAIDYLKSKARNYSYGDLVKHISLNAMEDAGFQIDTDGNVYAPEKYKLTEIREPDDLDDSGQ
jgi:DNA-directed RNA polymerase specialized sigma24 family protein